MRARTSTNLGLVLFGLASAVSGLTLQIKYHMHHQSRIAAAGWDYPTWSQLHKYGSVALLTLVIAHCIVNWKWLRLTWTKGRLHQHRLFVVLSLLFISSAFTGLGAWSLGGLGFTLAAERIVVEVHDKLTLFLVVLLVQHVWSRRRRLIR